MTIEYYIKNIYGVEKIYAADKSIAADIRLMSGKKILTPEIMEGLSRLGFKFKEILRPHPELKVLPQERR